MYWWSMFQEVIWDRETVAKTMAKKKKKERMKEKQWRDSQEEKKGKGRTAKGKQKREKKEVVTQVKDCQEIQLRLTFCYKLMLLSLSQVSHRHWREPYSLDCLGFVHWSS